jgi:PTH1 family peptidyl-tRNA hydrolase
MKLIIFQGNPGLKYRKTRHNIGFMVGDFYAKQRGIKWKMEKKFGAEIAEVESSSENRVVRILLAKPQLFYNRSGEAVRKIVDFYKIKPADILVVCDDFNLNFGQIRYREQGSDGGNNGLKSIIANLGTDQFARVRIGTGNDLRARIDDADFVLAKFNRDEAAELPKLQQKTAEIIDDFISGDSMDDSYQV